jgi:hypothetical protein
VNTFDTAPFFCVCPVFLTLRMEEFKLKCATVRNLSLKEIRKKGRPRLEQKFIAS